ncbi:PhzF family phenazine biosynthesis protein [Nocardia sp. NBC_01329]|uniref:PhzF family phenazine biosynthesis protein n=1 Tax=Nocardia sp. NBC_01329 TaxID=2903594 RepID=UPI002E147F70|nr:PhzF family phenazine biosynthesis protein [Nocardia sp. NBC_01329]
MTAEAEGGTQVEVVRVFTDAAGQWGNALGIARAGDVEGIDHRALAARLGYSETVVVEPPAGGIARMRIYTPAVELPFAGHPTVGTAWWLADQGTPVRTIEVPAGPVAVAATDGLTWVRARAEWAPDFTFHEFDDLELLRTLHPADFDSGQHYAWAWTDRARGTVRSRMFAPAMGIAEDEATGAGAMALTARLERDLEIIQGQGSQLFTRHDPGGWVHLGGRVAPDHPVVL